jgi:hypothetical protein
LYITYTRTYSVEFHLVKSEVVFCSQLWDEWQIDMLWVQDLSMCTQLWSPLIHYVLRLYTISVEPLCHQEFNLFLPFLLHESMVFLLNTWATELDCSENSFILFIFHHDNNRFFVLIADSKPWNGIKLLFIIELVIAKKVPILNRSICCTYVSV